MREREEEKKYSADSLPRGDKFPKYNSTLDNCYIFVQATNSFIFFYIRPPAAQTYNHRKRPQSLDRAGNNKTLSLWRRCTVCHYKLLTYSPSPSADCCNHRNLKRLPCTIRVSNAKYIVVESISAAAFVGKYSSDGSGGQWEHSKFRCKEFIYASHPCAIVEPEIFRRICIRMHIQGV